MKTFSTKILILMILLNIMAIAGYYFFFQYIETQSKTSLSLTSTLDLSQQKNSHLNALRSVIKETEGKRQQLATFLLSSDTEIPFIEQLEALGKSSALAIKTNNIASIVGGTATTKVLKMQLQTIGSWNNTLYFLSQVENLPYNIDIQGVSLGRQSISDKTAGSSWTATFDISVAESI
jgi:Tfp pilus assembly protein PilO